MRFLKAVLAIIIWPGDKFCAIVGQDTREDSGMLRGFVNNIFWSVLIVTIMAIAI